MMKPWQNLLALTFNLVLLGQVPLDQLPLGQIFLSHILLSQPALAATAEKTAAPGSSKTIATVAEAIEMAKEAMPEIKYELEKQPMTSYQGGSSHEATALNFPISKGWPESRCSSSPVDCVSFTGTPMLPSGRM